MPTTFTENYDSRKVTTDPDGDAQSAEFVYSLTGVADEDAGRILATSSTASTYGDLIRKSITLEPVHVDTANPDACIWEVTVQYGEDDELEEGESSYSFDTGGGSQHITQALSHVASYAPSGETAPDFKGAIGATENAVEGVDITVPAYTFSETHILPNSDVTAAYKGKLFALTGKTNNATFKGFAIGECLFLGASGSKRGKGDWEITFRFAASPNKTGLTVGSITGIAKKGWEYLWVRYKDAVDATAGALVKEPMAVYIEKVYEEGDFADLGIGT